MEPGTSQGRQRPEGTACVIPFPASPRTGSTNLWGENSEAELGVSHTSVSVAAPRRPRLPNTVELHA